MKKAAFLGGALVLCGLLAAGYYVFAPRETPPGQPPLKVLEDSGAGEFERQFNAAADSVRVVVLLSPT